MNKKWLGILLVLSIVSTSVLAWGVVTKTPKYSVHWMPAYQDYNTTKCIVKQNIYPNGTVFHTAYGIWGRKMDGSKVCFVPIRNNKETKKKVTITVIKINQTMNNTNTTGE